MGRSVKNWLEPRNRNRVAFSHTENGTNEKHKLCAEKKSPATMRTVLKGGYRSGIQVLAIAPKEEEKGPCASGEDDERWISEGSVGARGG